MYHLLIVSSYPLEEEPVVNNRLSAYISSGLIENFKITLVSPDKECTSVADNNHRFQHIRVGNSFFNKRSFFFRAINEIILSVSMVRKINSLRHDAVLLSIPSMFLFFSVFLLKKKTVFLDVRDVTWECLSNRTLLMRLVKPVFRYLALLNVRFIALVALTNRTEVEYFQHELGVHSSKLLLVPNGVSSAQFNSIVKTTLSDRPSKRVNVSYIGNVGLAQDLSTLIEAARDLPDIDFNIVGAGNDLERISAHTKSLNLINVCIHGRVPWDKIPSFYNDADILYAQLTSDYSRAMPSKLYEYLASGKFVLYGGEEQAPEILSNFDNHIVIEPGDPKVLQNTITTVIRGNRHRSLSSTNQSKIADQYIREKSVSHFLGALKSQYGI